MNYLPIIISSIVSASVSVLVTLFVLRIVLKKERNRHKKEEAVEITPGNMYVSSEISESIPPLQTKDLQVGDLPYQQEYEEFGMEKPETAESVMLRVFGEKVPAYKNRDTSPISFRFFKKLYAFVYTQLNNLTTTCAYVIHSFFNTLYTYISIPFVYVIFPCSKVIQKIQRINVGGYIKSLVLRAYSQVLHFFKDRKKTKTKKVQKKEITNSTDHTIVVPSVRQITQHAQALFSEQKNIQQNHLHFYIEALLGILFIGITAALFVFGIPFYSTSVFLFYLLSILILGSYMLSRHRSPRIFWTIGVTVWSALAYWQFLGKDTEVYIGAVVLFLCVFLSLYAVSSFFWYGIREEKYTALEQALFVLHPFLYLAGVYLLLISDLKYLVVLLCVAVLSMYVYFGQTLRQKKGLHVFATVCYFVSLIAGLSAISVLFEGFLRISALVFLLIAYMYKVREKSLVFLIPILLYIFGYTLSAVQTSDSFFPLANERFASYTLGAIVFFVLWSTVSHKWHVSSKKNVLLENTLFVAFLSITSVGLFSEITDIQKLTTLLPGISGDILNTAILLIASLCMYYVGKNRQNIVISLASITAALAAIVVVVTQLV
jgi:hypothetical protein